MSTGESDMHTAYVFRQADRKEYTGTIDEALIVAKDSTRLHKMHLLLPKPGVS